MPRNLDSVDLREIVLEHGVCLLACLFPGDSNDLKVETHRFSGKQKNRGPQAVVQQPQCPMKPVRHPDSWG